MLKIIKSYIIVQGGMLVGEDREGLVTDLTQRFGLDRTKADQVGFHQNNPLKTQKTNTK